MEANEMAPQKEPVANELLLAGVSACLKELKALRQEMDAILIGQQERLAIVQHELKNKQDIAELEIAMAREQEAHQWERSLPLCSESTDLIVAAIAAIKAGGITVNATGLNSKSGADGDKYSTCYEDLLEAFQRKLAEKGINIQSQLILGYYSKDDDILKTELRHKESCQFIASYSKIRVSLVGNNIPDPWQKRSCAISYAKRHNLQALLGL